MVLEELSTDLIGEISRQYPRLKSLNLADNAIQVIENLDTLSSLNRLDLSNNWITSIPLQLGDWLPYLQDLRLAHNQISSLKPLANCTRLRYINLEHNRITLFREVTALQELQSITSLQLQGNPIAQHDAYRQEVLTILPHLKSLDGQDVTPRERLGLTFGKHQALHQDAKVPINPRSASTNSCAPSPPKLLTPCNVAHSYSSVVPSQSIVSDATRDKIHDVSLETYTKAKHLLSSTSSAPQIISTEDKSVCAYFPSAAAESSNDHIDLLQRRIQALESILSLQDKFVQNQLSTCHKQHVSSIPTNLLYSVHQTDLDTDQVASNFVQLLASWRHKTMSLLVQMKSMELTHSQATSSLQQTITTWQEKEIEVARQRDVWAQKVHDLEAKQSLVQLEMKEIQKQQQQAEERRVQAVRTLSCERQTMQRVSRAISSVFAKESIFRKQFDRLSSAQRQLEGQIRQVGRMKDRLEQTKQLLVHREVRLRNSQAAIEAERRVMHDQRTRSQEASVHPSPPRRDKVIKSSTERAMRKLFHYLDPYETGLVHADKLVPAIASNEAILSSLGQDERRVKKLLHQLKSQIKRRTPSHTVDGNLTWGELMICCIPDMDSVEDSLVDKPLPPPFDSSCMSSKNTQDVSKEWMKDVKEMSREELCAQVKWLRQDRELLRRRVLQDARELQRRAHVIQDEWKEKVNQLISTNDILQRKEVQQTESIRTLERELDRVTIEHAQMKATLDTCQKDFDQKKTELLRQKEEAMEQASRDILREQQVWQKEMQDVSFQFKTLQTENKKHEMNVRRLERELAKREQTLVGEESHRIQELQNKLHKRDTDLTKLRRERTTILNALRDKERALDEEQRGPSVDSIGIQTSIEPETSSIACQTQASPRPKPLETRTRATSTNTSHSQHLHSRLERLESLSNSLLED